MRVGRRELGTVEREYLFQDSKQKLVLLGEIPLKRAKVFTLGAVTGMEACGVSARGIFVSSEKPEELNADKWPVPWPRC